MDRSPDLAVLRHRTHELHDRKRDAVRAGRMNARRGLRVGTKVLHEIASIGFGGGLAACLVINALADRASPDDFAAARQAYAAIARYVLVPSMVVVVVSGLIALAATRGYASACWAWLKALLGLSLFQATLLIAGASRGDDSIAAATAAADAALLDSLLRSERNTLWLLIAISVANVVLAVWRPRLTVRIR
jgi:hypothetical protein